MVQSVKVETMNVHARLDILERESRALRTRMHGFVQTPDLISESAQPAQSIQNANAGRTLQANAAMLLKGGLGVAASKHAEVATQIDEALFARDSEPTRLLTFLFCPEISSSCHFMASLER